MSKLLYKASRIHRLKVTQKNLGRINHPFLAIVQKLHPFLNISKMLRTQRDSNAIEARTISVSLNT